jgi:hypothetical protein
LVERPVAEQRGLQSVRVVGVDVHSSESGCSEHPTCHLLEARGSLFSICDPRGAIRTLYDVGQADRLYLIGPDHRLLDSTLVRDADRLRHQLGIEAALFAERLARQQPQEWSE